MKKFKINSTKFAKNHSETVYPNLSSNEFEYRTVSLTPNHFNKLEQMRAKYKLSRSAIIRILLDSIEI